MFIVITVLILLVAIVLGLVVLVQNGKGGGLAANFASQNQVMGVRKTTDFLEKATWFLAALMLVLCILSAALVPSTRQQESQDSGLKGVPSTTQTAPAAAPSANTAAPVK